MLIFVSLFVSFVSPPALLSMKRNETFGSDSETESEPCQKPHRELADLSMMLGLGGKA